MCSSSSMRTFGVVLHKFSNGVFSRRPSAFLLHNTILLSTSLTSASSLSPFDTTRALICDDNSQARKIWTFPPLCMGRRSGRFCWLKVFVCSVKLEAQDAKKAKLYSRIEKEVVSAVKKRGPNPTSNTDLAAVHEKAKELDVPQEILERNIKKASEKGQEDYIEKIYEVYGYGGVSMMVEVSTDKITCSVAKIREMVKDYGGKMADSGSVVFKFRSVWLVNIKVTDAEKDQLLGIALDSGAEDLIEL